MEISHVSRPSRRRSTVVRVGVLSLSTLSLLAFAGCSGDDDDDDAQTTTDTVIVDEDFPGDALDATCARLEAGGGDDRTATASALLDELIGIGGEELAVNTLEMAVVDRCPDWSDPVTAAIEARG